MKLRNKARLLTFIGATVLTVGLGKQVTYGRQYINRPYDYYYSFKHNNISGYITACNWQNDNWYIEPEQEDTLEQNEQNPDNLPEIRPDIDKEVDSVVSSYEVKVVELTNRERVRHGLPELKLDVGLSKIARLKSKDMYDNNYFNHNSPTYGSPFDMIKQFGMSYISAGENIAKGQRSPEEVVNAWMNSPGHRQNILGNYTHIGVGYIESSNIWTQMFISK